MTRGWVVQDVDSFRVIGPNGVVLAPPLRVCFKPKPDPRLRKKPSTEWRQPLVPLEASLRAWRGAVAHLDASGRALLLKLNGASAKLLLRPIKTPRAERGPLGPWWKLVEVSTLPGTSWLLLRRETNAVMLVIDGVIPGLRAEHEEEPGVAEKMSPDTWVRPSGTPRPLAQVNQRSGIVDDAGMRWALCGGFLFPLDPILALVKAGVTKWVQDAKKNAERLVALRDGIPVAAISACTSTAEQLLADAEVRGEVPHLPDLLEEEE